MAMAEEVLPRVVW